MPTGASRGLIGGHDRHVSEFPPLVVSALMLSESGTLPCTQNLVHCHAYVLMLNSATASLTKCDRIT